MFCCFNFVVVAASAPIGGSGIEQVGSSLGEPLKSDVFGKVGAAVDSFGERFGCYVEDFPVNTSK